MHASRELRFYQRKIVLLLGNLRFILKSFWTLVIPFEQSELFQDLGISL